MCWLEDLLIPDGVWNKGVGKPIVRLMLRVLQPQEFQAAVSQKVLVEDLAADIDRPIIGVTYNLMQEFGNAERRFGV